MITREMDYGIRIVRALYQNGQQSAAELTRAEGIPTPFVHKIVKNLIRASGKDLILNECLADGHRCSSPQGTECGVHREFCRIQGVFEQELQSKPVVHLFQTGLTTEP